MEVLDKGVKDLSERLEVDASAHKEGTEHTHFLYYLELFSILFLIAFSRGGAVYSNCWSPRHLGTVV